MRRRMLVSKEVLMGMVPLVVIRRLYHRAGIQGNRRRALHGRNVTGRGGAAGLACDARWRATSATDRPGFGAARHACGNLPAQRWHNRGVSRPFPATVASANRSSRVAEGFLDQLMFPSGKRSSAHHESDSTSVVFAPTVYTTPIRATPISSGAMRLMSRRCTKTTLPIQVACPKPGANYFDALQHVPAVRRQRQPRTFAHQPVVNAFAERAKQSGARVVIGGRCRYRQWAASARPSSS
jgi:hypothetical protein